MKTLCGLVLFGFAGKAIVPGSEMARGWIGMIGTVLTLHFGLFHLLSCVWRSAGIDAPPLMIAPLRSTRLAEFWGVRWNTAFRDLTHKFLFRPLAGMFGPVAATLVGFAVSGLVHDAVISIPAGRGYGLPTLYFVVQGLGVLFERSMFGMRFGLRRGWSGRMFTGCIVLLPLPCLFHPPFVRDVFVPFLRACGTW